MEHEGQMGVHFESGGHRLLGTLFLALGDRPKPTAVVLHGCPGIEKNYDLAHALRDHGWNSLIFHYRGCWGSEGVYALKTIPADVRAALDDLSSGRHPHVDSERLVLIGHSLGGWAAVLAAAADPRPRGVAIYGALADPRGLEFSADYIAAEFTPWLNGITPEQFVEQANALDNSYIPVEQAALVAPRPLLILHGGLDTTIPPEQGQALFARARDPREYILVPAANHAFSWHRPELRRHILDWLDRLDMT
jgi:hypothetical protein